MIYIINKKSVIHDNIDGEVLAMSSETGTYYSIRGTAAIIWEFLINGCSSANILNALNEIYPQSAKDIDRDVDAALEKFLAEGLVIAINTEVSNSEIQFTHKLEAWIEPCIEIYTDMQDLLLFDPIHEVDPESGWPNVSEKTN